MGVKTKVLFVCVHNSARSQMAEPLLNHMAGDRFEAMSAGIDPGVLNPLTIEVMRGIGLDISENQSKMAFELYRSGKMFQYIIGVCDNAATREMSCFP